MSASIKSSHPSSDKFENAQNEIASFSDPEALRAAMDAYHQAMAATLVNPLPHLPKYMSIVRSNEADRIVSHARKQGQGEGEYMIDFPNGPLMSQDKIIKMLAEVAVSKLRKIPPHSFFEKFLDSDESVFKEGGEAYGLQSSINDYKFMKTYQQKLEAVCGLDWTQEQYELSLVQTLVLNMHDRLMEGKERAFLSLLPYYP